MQRASLDEAKFAVYLIDPGPRGSGVIALLQEVTGESTGNCAQMVRTSPTFVANCRSKGAAEDLVARFKEFDAVAVVRPANRPMREGGPSDLLHEGTPRSLPYVLIGLAVAQLAVSAWWGRSGNPLGAVAGLILAAIVIGASIVLLRRK
jgi:hypothetical protein